MVKPTKMLEAVGTLIAAASESNANITITPSGEDDRPLGLVFATADAETAEAMLAFIAERDGARGAEQVDVDVPVRFVVAPADEDDGLDDLFESEG